MAKFDEKKELFCQGKALGRSNKDLASELEITPKTATAWGKDPSVQGRIRDLLEENWLESQAILLTLQKEAVKVLAKLMTSQDEAIKLKAASFLLSLCSDFPRYL